MVSRAALCSRIAGRAISKCRSGSSRTKHYQGAAWYGRTIEIPPDWQGQRITLTLERPHWETRLWLDDREIGRRDSLSTPHIYDWADVSPEHTA